MMVVEIEIRGIDRYVYVGRSEEERELDGGHMGVRVPRGVVVYTGRGPEEEMSWHNHI
jgi:hypothetical protein